MTTQQSIFIEASITSVFEYLVKLENRKDYIPALEKVIMLDPSPIKLGSRFTEVSKIAGRRLENTYQIVGFEKNKRISAKATESIFPIQADLLLEKNGGGCDLTISLDFKLTGVFRMASGVIKGIVNQQAKDILRGIKGNME
ncbi:MAG: carbon monoxide dehydrogenase subunit G [Flavobacteriales bacterium]|jgi:carbon monoxide dehydrogenase subunit G